MKFITILLLAILCAPCVSAAESDHPKSEESTTNNSGEAKRYLPGEEVVTDSGQKLKVWSTRGAVPVSQAPEPFKVRESDSHINVIVDGRAKSD